ncbi:MAG: hypothetical protein IT193_06970 [Propionibacteriaceae bacterium]|nr:hypothetical protein [Propionibacteriaceae bacterium]
MLSQPDRLRAAGFGADRLAEFVLGRAVIAGLVAGMFPDAGTWSVGTGKCRSCGARHGPVEVTGVPVVASVSYAPGLVVAAAAPTSRVSRLGIDVEPAAADPRRTRDLQRLLGVSAEPVMQRWTRIEAVLKADGRGLRVDPGDVRMSSGGAGIPGDPARYRVADVAGPAGYRISVAWCGEGASAVASGPATG